MRNLIIAFVFLFAFAAHAATTSTTTAQITKLQNGGTGADLSATGGAGAVLKQTTAGGAITVGQISCGDLSDDANSCAVDATNAANLNQGTIAPARLGSGTYDATTVLRGDNTWGTASVGTLYCSSLTNAAASCSTDATNASNMATGTVGTARLGSGSANSGTYLRGDLVWASPPTAPTGFTSCAVNGSGTVMMYGCDGGGTYAVSVVGSGCQNTNGGGSSSVIRCH